MFYTAKVTHEDGAAVIIFPDCPGCQTQADPGESPIAMAREALEGWLRSTLEFGELAPLPSPNVRAPKGGETLDVPISFDLSVAVQIRAHREARKLTQTALAAKVGMLQPQLARMERATANPTAASIGRVFEALGLDVTAAPHAGVAALAGVERAPVQRFGKRPPLVDPEAEKAPALRVAAKAGRQSRPKASRRVEA